MAIRLLVIWNYLQLSAWIENCTMLVWRWIIGKEELHKMYDLKWKIGKHKCNNLKMYCLGNELMPLRLFYNLFHVVFYFEPYIFCQVRRAYNMASMPWGKARQIKNPSLYIYIQGHSLKSTKRFKKVGS